MSLRVTLYGEPVLREKGAVVERFDEELSSLAAAMLETMEAEEGIGLAAQQVDRALQLCVVDIAGLPPDEAGRPFFDGREIPADLLMPLVLANPTVTPLPSEEVPYEEGCLSFPGVRGNVARPERIAVRYQDLQGAWHDLKTGGLLARVIQHEVDHLNGVLFIDRMDPRTLRAVESKVKKLKRSTRDMLKRA